MDTPQHITLIEAGSPGLNIYSHVAMGRGLPILATVLRDRGYPVSAFIEDISGKGSVDWESVRGSSVIGFSAITCTLTRTAELIAQARRVNPEAVIVLGGPEPTCAPKRAFDAGADYVIRGEAEFSLPRFLEALRGCGEIRDVPGIVWKDAGGLHHGPAAVQLTRDEINALPLVDTTLVCGYPGHTTASVWRSRGCPERCEFCEVHEIWPRYVLRDEETSVRELVSRQAEGKGGAFLVDDNSAANKPSFKRFLRGAIEQGYNRPLAVQLRADAVFDKDGALDHELLGLLRDVAPVTMLCVGVESASNEDLAAIGKHESAERMARALKAMKRYGLVVHGMMIAFANDADDTLKRNGAYARKHVTSLQYLFEVPLPGTKRTLEHEAAGRVMWSELPDLKFLDGMHVAVRPNRISPREMQEIVTTQYRRFYSRGRLLAAFLNGLFLRRRSLPSSQRMRLRELHGWKRVREWAWMHLQFKFAPWALLRIGRQRVLEFMRDPEYLAYLRQLDG
ncbi:MAG: B12-binding domain-containing radical SAM protein [Coriobacteriia bacterium]